MPNSQVLATQMQASCMHNFGNALFVLSYAMLAVLLCGRQQQGLHQSPLPAHQNAMGSLLQGTTLAAEDLHYVQLPCTDNSHTELHLS